MRQPLRKLLRSIGKDLTLGFTQFPLSRPAEYLRLELQHRAMLRSADIVQERMSEALFCESRLTHLEYALSQKAAGAIAEFGVYKGTTINFIASQCPEETIYGFDSFEGLPEHWAGNRYSSRNFDRKGKPPKVKNNVELVIGWFNETLPEFLKKNNSSFGFIHIDCDIYSSTKQILDLTVSRIADGCIIVFDEFFNYHAFEQHEYRAFTEFIESNALDYEFISYSGQQVGVRINGRKQA